MDDAKSKEVRNLERKLEKLLLKRDQKGERHMQRYRDGSATRAKTTTYNATVSDLNEQIQELRDEIKILTTENL